MTSEAHLTYRWYQAMNVPWAGDIWLSRVRARRSSVLQGNLSMLQHYHCAYQTTDFPWLLLFREFVSNLCSAVMCFIPHWIHPSSTLPPDCCALTSVLQGCSACMQSHTGDCTDLETSSLSHCKDSAWRNIFLGLPVSLPTLCC